MMIHQVYGFKLAFLAIVAAILHPVQAWNVVKEYLVETCPPELDSDYPTDVMLTAEDFDAMTGYQPMARTLAEAFPDRPTLFAISQGEECSGVPSYSNQISLRDWLPMVVGMGCAFVVIGLLLSEMLLRAGH